MVTKRGSDPEDADWRVGCSRRGRVRPGVVLEENGDGFRQPLLRDGPNKRDRGQEAAPHLDVGHPAAHRQRDDRRVEDPLTPEIHFLCFTRCPVRESARIRKQKMRSGQKRSKKTGWFLIFLALLLAKPNAYKCDVCTDIYSVRSMTVVATSCNNLRR